MPVKKQLSNAEITRRLQGRAKRRRFGIKPPSPSVALPRKYKFDLYKDGLTQGAISRWLTCREQFRLAYIEGWKKSVVSEAMELGSAFHYMAERLTTLVKGRLATPAEALAEYRKTRISKAKPALTAPEQQLVLSAVSKALPLANAYQQWWVDRDAERSWVLREETFHMIHGPTSIPLRGRWDGIFRDKKGRLYLHEMKTKGFVDEDGLQDALPHDLQTMLYCLAIKERFQEEPRGVVYDVIRTPKIRQRKEEPDSEFAQRIAADVACRPEDYFLRLEVTFLEGDLQAWAKRVLDPILWDLDQWYRTLVLTDPSNSWVHYPNPTGLFTRFGGKSDFFHAITKGDFSGLTRRKVPYEELLDD